MIGVLIMFYRAVAATCPGNNKEYNSNNIYLNSKYITEEYKSSEILLRQKKEQEGLQFYAITEGRGAERYADEASLIAIKKLSDFHKKALEIEISSDYDVAADVLYSYVEEYIKEANEAVIAKATELPENDIHTSIAAVAIYEKALITCNLGNTKIFLFRKGNLSKLSEDHNHAYRMFKNGLIDEDKLATHSKKDKLTQYLGILPDDMQPEPYYSEAEIKHGDILTICSSSFCDCVSEEELCEIIKTSKSLSQIIEKMMAAAAEKGFEKDTSIMVIRADSHEKAAAPISAAGVAAAAGTTKKAKTANNDKAKETGEKSFVDKMKSILGLSSDAENEKIWPALVTFACCILVVIVLAFLGIKIYNASKNPGSGATKPPVSTLSPTPSVVTQVPTDAPTTEPTDVPTTAPTDAPTTAPTESPTTAPTDAPTTVPTESPTTAPTDAPTTAPTDAPTTEPTDEPTVEPTEEPTEVPTEEPTADPTEEPTEAPTEEPTEEPSEEPTTEPTNEPTPTPEEGVATEEPSEENTPSGEEITE